MRKKLFTFLLALTASIGMMWAETVVVINKSEFTSSGVTKGGVTLAPSSNPSSSGSMTSSNVEAMNGSFEFSTSLGKFTGITIETDANIMEIYEGAFTSAGWPTGDNLGKSAAWTGESETVLISCVVFGMDNITITCTIEPASTPATSGDGDKLSGAFSVSSTKVVYFSKGNLQYTKSTGKWKIMDHQYDVVETLSQNVGTDYASQDVITLFGWGTSGWDNTAADATSVHYQPYSTCNTNHSTANNNYQYGPSNANVVGSSTAASAESWSKEVSSTHPYENYDWGVFNSGDLGAGWRTLTNAEWGYLFNSRTPGNSVNGVSNARYTEATINTDGTAVNGIILFPDDAVMTSVDGVTWGTINGTSAWTTTCTIAGWTALETAGCVFLPAAGDRNGTSVDGVGSDGTYWSSSANSATYAYFLTFSSGYVNSQSYDSRGYGCSVRLVSETAPSGGSTPAELQVSEFEVPGSWNGDYDTELTASDFPGFVAASAAEAQAWSGAPASGWSCLIYAFEDDEAKVCYFVDGVFDELGTRKYRDDIYYRFEQGYQIYYTGTAPVYTLLSTITLQLENSQIVENHTNPNVASIGKSCNVTYAQYANYIAWKTDPWSSGEMLLVMPKAGYTITKVVFTRDNNPSNKVTVYSAPFTASVTNDDNISKIEVYGEAETPATPVVVASWTSNECNVVLTNDGKLMVSKNEYNGEMEDMNSYQSSKWRCFSNLVTSVEIQEGVTRIGDYAFYNMQNISSVSFPNSLLSIGDGAFFDCPITGNVVIPEHVETIGSNAFAMIGQSASTVSIPASVTSIGQWAFQNKSTEDITSTNVITAINVDAANPNYCSVDGILYSKDMTTLIAYPAGKTATEYVIPSTVTEVKSRALYSCVYITTLTIPAGTSLVEYDGYAGMAFSGCYGLTDIYNNATTPQTISSVLSWMDKGQGSINLYIPSGTRAAYEAADGWKDLNIIDSTPTPANPVIKLNADFSGSWANTEAFTDNGDGTASLNVTTLTAGEWYHFGVIVDDTWVSDHAAFSRENPSRVIEGNEPEMWFQADIAGTYTFTWEYATNTLTIGYPEIHTYTAVGQNLGVFGNSWDPSITANDLVLQEDGSYKWEKEKVAFTGAITIQYRVCEDHAWGVAYPATSEDAASFEIPSLGDYKITITYNPVGNVISASAEKIAKPTIQLNGNFSGEWADTEAFEVSELPMHSYAKLTKLLEPGTYEFGVTVNGEWRANGSAYTRDNYSYIIEEGHTGNLTINVDVKGYYSFFWYYDDNRLSIDYSRVCGMYWKDVTAGNFEVTLGQESEVTLPKVWATSMAFVSNIASGSDQVRLGSTDETVATIAYTLSMDGLGTLTFHNAGECDIYVVHDITNLYCYDSCAFHLTVLPAPTPAPTDEQVPTNADPENPSYHYSTFFHSTQNYKLTNDGTQAFIADLSGSDLVLTEIAKGTQVIPMNTAVIFRKTGSADPVVLDPTDEAGVSFSANNDLEGVDDATMVTDIAGLTLENCYVLSGTALYGVGFYKINGNQLKAHKAYVKYNGSQNNAPRRMRFVFNQEQVVTGIDNANADIKAEKRIENGQLIIIKNGVRYNVQGQLIK